MRAISTDRKKTFSASGTSGIIEAGMERLQQPGPDHLLTIECVFAQCQRYIATEKDLQLGLAAAVILDAERDIAPDALLPSVSSLVYFVIEYPVEVGICQLVRENPNEIQLAAVEVVTRSERNTSPVGDTLKRNILKPGLAEQFQR